MKVVSFLNPKGGSGKTTAVINVSTALVRSGYNIAVIDTDPQMSLANWSKPGKAAFDVFTTVSEKDVYGIKKDLAAYDIAIIDGAGSLSVLTSAAARVSDLVIIPVTPSPLDFSSAGSLVAVLEAQSVAAVRFLITRKIEQAIMLNVLKESIKDTGIKQFRTAITQRQIYVKSILEGESVFESNDGAAMGEIEILAKEMLCTFE